MPRTTQKPHPPEPPNGPIHSPRLCVPNRKPNLPFSCPHSSVDPSLFSTSSFQKSLIPFVRFAPFVVQAPIKPIHLHHLPGPSLPSLSDFPLQSSTLPQPSAPHRPLRASACPQSLHPSPFTLHPSTFEVQRSTFKAPILFFLPILKIKHIKPHLFRKRHQPLRQAQSR